MVPEKYLEWIESTTLSQVMAAAYKWVWQEH